MAVHHAEYTQLQPMFQSILIFCQPKMHENVI